VSPEQLPKIDAALALLQRIAIEFRPASFASSLGAEDMVLTDMIARHRFGIEIFTLDTGRLHQDTLNLLPRIAERYKREVRVMHPDAAAVADYVTRHGRDAFYGSVELRKRCCHIRKVEPLQRALAGRKAWITGLRRAQSSARAYVAVQEFDDAHGIAKFNPLADWTEGEVWDYLRAHEVPYNPLHEQGYPSIGCAPCTRSISPGEDPRAGRWWWEQEAGSECGLHFDPDGRLVRTNKGEKVAQ
jgi:phosphoadenosine phosphosulfate reductase